MAGVARRRRRMGAGSDLRPGRAGRRFLDRVVAAGAKARWRPPLRWISCSVEAELLLNEIEDSTTRVSAPRRAAKQYPSWTVPPTR